MEKNKDYRSEALLSFSRVTGAAHPLVGSSILHENTIMLRIKPATKDRNLNEDRYYADGAPYIEVEMSQAQFAEAITSFNMGSGTPVTLKRIHNEAVQEPIHESKILEFEEEFQSYIQEINNKMKDSSSRVAEILEKKSITKADREEILKGIRKLHMEISSNIPFVQEQFNRQMAKTVNESKKEIEAFIQTQINAFGLQKMKEIAQEQQNTAQLTLKNPNE